MLFRSRSGAPPRFLIFAGPYDSLIGKLIPNAAFYGLGLALVIGLGSLGIGGLRSLLDPAHTTRLLNRPVTAREADAGALRQTGRVLSRRASKLPPICVVVHQWYQSGKNGGWREDWRQVFNQGADFVTTDGKRVPISTELISFAPAELVESRHAAEWSLQRSFREGRYLEQCVEHDETVFIDGCIRDGSIGPCGYGGSVVFTTGDGSPQRRIDESAATLVSRIAWGGVALWIVILWLARLVRARPLASALIDRFTVPAPKSAWIAAGLIAAVPVVHMLSLWVVHWGATIRSDANVSRSGHLLGLAVIAAHALTLIVLMQRRRRLAGAVRPIIDRPTVPLARADGDLVELAVRVHPNAPVQAGPLSGEPRAWWALVIDEEYGQGKSTATRRVQETSSQPGVPVMDESGEGMLELGEARLDVRSVGMSVRASTWGEAANRIRTLLNQVPKTARHVRFIVEERFVTPTEALYVLGHVERVHAEQARSGYRHAPTTAVIRATGDSKLFVHAGSERSLLSGIRLEQGLASAMVWTIGGLAVLMAGAQIWLVTR